MNVHKLQSSAHSHDGQHSGTYRYSEYRFGVGFKINTKQVRLYIHTYMVYTVYTCVYIKSMYIHMYIRTYPCVQNTHTYVHMYTYSRCINSDVC